MIAQDTFVVTVSAVNDNPVVILAISDVNVDEDAVDTTIELTNNFGDTEDAASSLVYTVDDNDNTSVLDASISGSILTLDYVANASGTANITINATDTGGLIAVRPPARRAPPR